MRAGKIAGGAAAQGGFNYQSRVAAWVAVSVLAEQEATPLWGLASDTTLDFIRCETEQPLDDLLIGNSQGGHVFVQVKTTLKSSGGRDSDLASVAKQIVHQFLAYTDDNRGDQRWERPLRLDCDRLLLVLHSGGPQSTTRHLPTLLNRLHQSSESITEIACNIPERDVLTKLQDQLRHAWLEALNTEPSSDQILQILRFLWVQTVDVNDGGRDEREAKNLLRSSVLEIASDADKAWATLVVACTDCASIRSGADRVALQNLLTRKGIPLRAPRSYRPDIERLRQNSESIIGSLGAQRVSQIPLGDRVVKIERPSSNALRTVAEQTSVVVVGEPGAGKSGALHDLAASLISESRDVVFLAVDRIEAGSMGRLREELGLTHNVPDVFCNWPADREPILIVDGLDAARSSGADQTLYDLLTKTMRECKQWRVVASIRQFDLRYHTTLQELFAGRPPTEFSSPEFSHLCHFTVPLLDRDLEEWKQIGQQAPELLKLFVDGTDGLRKLLFVPFNVRLAAELLGSGMDIERLTPIETQIGLLDLYWRERVIRTDHQGNAREAILTRTVENMVAARSLQVNRRNIASDAAALSAALDDLLSAHVLSEWAPTENNTFDRSVLTFAHHVLFDYAAARLLLRGTTETLVEFLGRDPDVVIAIRPSVVMHFQYEWHRDKANFWEAVFQVINSEQIPEIGKLIGPTVAVDSAKGADEFAPFTQALFSAVLATRETADRCLRHIVGALLVHAVHSPTGLSGEGKDIWADLLDTCTSVVRINIAYAVRPILLNICNEPSRMTNQQLQHAGMVARRLLQFALDQELHDSMLVGSGIEAVCRTFQSNLEESAVILRRCLEPNHVSSHGYEELFRLGHEVDRLIAVDSSLVEDIYRAAFSNYDPREDPTPLLGSGILRLTTTPRQEFDMARWLLTTKYKEFIEGAPLHATRALLIALQTFIAEQYASRFGDQLEEFFEFNGQQATVSTDYSEIWDGDSAHGDDGSVRMLKSFQDYIEKLWASDETGLQRQLLDLLILKNRTAAVWRKLLISATKHTRLADDLRPLAWAVPILVNYDTSRVAGDYLSATYPRLDDVDRRKIEEAILSIPRKANEKSWSDPEFTRNRLLGCLDADLLVTEDAKRIREQVTPPPNVPVFRTTTISGVYTDEDYLRDQGVTLDAEPNRLLLQLAEPAKLFGNTHRNNAPSLEQAMDVFPHLLRLREELNTASSSDVPESEQTLAWGYLVEAARAVAEVDELPQSDLAVFVRQVLLEAGGHSEPSARPEYDAQFDIHPSWGSPSPRVDAAHGLIRLSRFESFADAEVLGAVSRLLRDPVPAVRYQIAINLAAIYNTSNDLMWQLLERCSDEETSRGVLQGLLAGALRRLAAYAPERVTNCVLSIFNRIRDGEGATEVRRRCISILVGLYLWQNNARCGDVVHDIVDDPCRFDTETGQIIFDVRNWLNLGTVKESKAEQDAVRLVSFDLLEQILRSIRTKWVPLEEKFRKAPLSPLTSDEQTEARTLGRLAESVCQQVYFVSGAYKDSSIGNAEKIPMGTEERQRFLIESRKVLESLSEFSLPSLTHHLLEMLEFFIPFDPKRVFLLVNKVVRSGKAGGYQYESMAVDLIVRLVERFIAEFRHILRGDEECRRALIEILDIFVDAGWASARKLTYRMEEIFR